MPFLEKTAIVREHVPAAPAFAQLQLIIR